MRHLVQSSSSPQLTRLVTALSLGCFFVLAGLAGAQAKGAPDAVAHASVIRAKPSSVPQLSAEEFARAREALLVKSFVREAEPNDTFGTATPLGTTPVRVRADNYAVPVPVGGDVDFYSFTAAAGDRVYVATMTSFSSGSGDTLLEVRASDGTTILESDDEDGGLGGSASNIAGLVLPTAGTYFIRVAPFTTTLAGTIRPYDLYVQLLSGSPTAETEPNNNGTPQATAGNGWMSGAVTPLNDTDTFTVAANAGDTIAVILDVDPERDAPEWNARIGIAAFNNFILLINSSAVGGTFDDANPSEAMFMTVDTTGSYQVFVDESTTVPAATGNLTNTYAFSVNVIPGDSDRTTSNTCTGTTGPIADLATTDFTCNITTAAIIDNLQLRFNETHGGATPALADLDVSLISPDGNEVVLFDDPATTAGATAPQFNLMLDDEAAIPVGIFGVDSGMRYQPESFARLNYFKGMQAQGTWTLRVRDDTTTNTGTLNSWSLIVGEAPANPNCTSPVPVISTGFETDDAGFTHTGTQDEWARGLPTLAPITTCHGGTNCFKTDLVGTYNASGNFDLLSPNINLTSVAAPIALSWWQKYQFDSAGNDPFWVEVRIVGNPASAVKVWEWKGALQTRGVGNPTTTVNMSAGWGQVQADLSSFAGQNIEVRFHGETSAATQLAGWAIDDFQVQSACLVPVELIDFDVE